ncbi:MAG: hypothetical protein Q9162_007814 [Coniocarpon cinnabarinum]
MPKAKARTQTPTTPSTNNVATHRPPPNSDPTTSYEEQQDDEIEVLRSVFPEAFEEIETKTAWAKRSEKSFRLKLIADSDTSLYCNLTVTFTATYPKSVPLLSLHFSENVPSKTREKVQHVIDVTPRKLAGEVMILELSNEVRDTLEDASQALAAGRAVPSLEQERFSREAEAESEAQKAREREGRRVEAEKAEEERAMQQLVEEELKRRDLQRQKREAPTLVSAHDMQHADAVFDQPVNLPTHGGKPLVFQAVQVVKAVSDEPNAKIFKVRPMTLENSSIHDLRLLVLERFTVRHQKASKSILDLEDDLEKLKALSHENLMKVYDFKVSSSPDAAWRFDVLLEEVEGHSVKDVLNMVDTLPVNRSRGYTIDILRALDYLHKNGLTHGALCARNVNIHDIGSSKVLKLTNVYFKSRLEDLDDRNLSLATSSQRSAYPSSWSPPETTTKAGSEVFTSKRDIWDVAVLLIQMTLGVSAFEKKQPQALLSDTALTEPFRDLLRDALREDPRKRSSAFDLIPYEFLRTDCEALKASSATEPPRLGVRRLSSFTKASEEDDNTQLKTSRYANEWFETSRLGKGGFGEVVKARNKLDGRVYAIKKIVGKTQLQLSEVLKEVFVLATLNHPYVVRYFGAWPEDEREPHRTSRDPEPPYTPSATTESDSVAPRESEDVGFSAGGIDFISSSGYPKIEFDDSEDSESDADVDIEFDRDSQGPDGRDSASPNHSNKQARQTLATAARATSKATLYIQMEFCEKLTLRDVIRKGIQDNSDEIWRMFRQVVEGLAHIHSHDIIHRDLKPENIFIDLGNNLKIGDFGLATTGQTNIKHRQSDSTVGPSGDMTLSVGTALYVAPELQSGGSGNYSAKVDMYSLGIIFFEMCVPLSTAMERVRVLSQMRLKDHMLPTELQSGNKQLHGQIILMMLKHKPSERPSSAELLRSGKIPIKVEDEQIRQTISRLSDPASPYFSRALEAFFAHSSNSLVQARLWEQSRDSLVSTDATNYVQLQYLVKERMTEVFRRYGAIESSRQGIFPKSDYYSTAECAFFLDPSGTTVQLPYDLILPHARSVARRTHISSRSFTFGFVYRASPTGGAPRSNREADFDIVSLPGEDTTLAEAETVKCLDDLVFEFPCFHETPMCFHLSHSSLLDAILDHSRVPAAHHATVKDVLGKLHIGSWTWQKIRGELRAPAIGVSASTIDELSRFDFRDTPEKALRKMQAIFEESPHLDTVHSVFTHLTGLCKYLKRFGFRRRVYVSPLSSINDKFYRSGVMFQLLFDSRRRDIVAAGGRYDALIQALSSQQGSFNTATPRAVGTNIAWERIVTSMARMQKQSGIAYLKNPDQAVELEQWNVRPVDVLIASFDPTVLRSTGIRLVTELRAFDIKTQLAKDARSTDEIVSHYGREKHSWLVIIKHEGFSSGKPDLKVRSMDSKAESVDVQSSELVSYIRSEIREREEGRGTSNPARLLRHASQPDGHGDERKADVHVLIAQHKTKKSNKARIIEDAQSRVKDLLTSYVDGPIAAVETRDEILEKLRDTKLSDGDTWRKVIQNVPLSERQYCHDLMDLIESFKTQYGESSRKCFIYNFRTGYCIDYDLWI